MCEFKEKKGCNDCKGMSSIVVDVEYFWSKKITIGNIENISKCCMCINTKYCLPLDSKIELFIPFKRKVLSMLARMSRYKHIDSLNDTMSVEVLNPSTAYLDFVCRLNQKSSIFKFLQNI
jgi:hypothetical protein